MRVVDVVDDDLEVQLPARGHLAHPLHAALRRH